MPIFDLTIDGKKLAKVGVAVALENGPLVLITFQTLWSLTKLLKAVYVDHHNGVIGCEHTCLGSGLVIDEKYSSDLSLPQDVAHV